MIDNTHRCAARNRCRDKVLDERLKMWAGARIEEQRGLCHRCTVSVRVAVREIANDHGKLSTAVGDRLVTGNEWVSGTREPPMPLNGAVLALRSSLSEWAEAALWMVAEELQIDVRERHKAKGWPVKEYPVVAQAARVLPDCLKALLTAPPQPVSYWSATGNSWHSKEMDGVEIALKLRDLHADVNSILGETNPRTKLSMPCPVADCGCRGTLGVDPGETDVTCAACGGRWSRVEYDWLASLLIDDHEQEETALLKYLLAEAYWKLGISDPLLKEVRRVAGLTEEQLEGIDGWAVVQLLRELVS
jgi:hypothetical protein